MPGDPGVFIKSVKPGSKVEKILKPGDKLLKVTRIIQSLLNYVHRSRDSIVG